jgi:hypothetical protein
MASGGLTTATAFWSYAHSDDDGSDGQIRRLKEQADHAFKRHSGEELKSLSANCQDEFCGRRQRIQTSKNSSCPSGG